MQRVPRHVVSRRKARGLHLVEMATDMPHAGLSIDEWCTWQGPAHECRFNGRRERAGHHCPPPRATATAEWAERSASEGADPIAGPGRPGESEGVNDFSGVCRSDTARLPRVAGPGTAGRAPSRPARLVYCWCCGGGRDQVGVVSGEGEGRLRQRQRRGHMAGGVGGW